MSLMTGARAPHPGEDELLRWIDRQLDLEGSRRMRAHLGTCAGCAARLDALRERSRQVSAWLTEVPVQLPDPSRRALALAAVERAHARRRVGSPGLGGTALRIAAMVTLMLGVTLSTGTGRSWLGDRVEQAVGPDPGPLGETLLRVFGRGGEARLRQAPNAGSTPVQPSGTVPAPPPAPTRAKPAPPRAAAAVTFGPAGRELVLVFDHLQERGQALLSIGDVGQAAARISRAEHGEKLLATATGLQVRNGPRSRAEYDIVVPNRFRVIRVRIAKRRETVIRVAPAKRAWIWTINLENTALR
jgi:hypothetical protein